MCGNVRAILYPDLKNSSPAAAEILYQKGILYQGASSQKFHTSGWLPRGALLGPLLNITFKRCKSCCTNISGSRSEGVFINCRLMQQGLVARALNSLLSAEISACYHPLSPTPHSYLISSLMIYYNEYEKENSWEISAWYYSLLCPALAPHIFIIYTPPLPPIQTRNRWNQMPVGNIGCCLPARGRINQDRGRRKK